MTRHERQEQQLRDAFAATGTRARPRDAWEREVWRRVLRDEAPLPRPSRLQGLAVAAVGVMSVVVIVMGWKLWGVGEELEHHRAVARELLLERDRAAAAAEAETQRRLMEAELAVAKAELREALSECRADAQLPRATKATDCTARRIRANSEKLRELNEKNRARKSRALELRRRRPAVACDSSDPLCGL